MCFSCLFTFFSPPDGSVLVTYTNDEGPIANSSIIDASKLGEQLPSCLFTLPFICLHVFVYISRPIWVSLLCHRGGICSTSTSHLHGIYTVTGESQLFVYIFREDIRGVAGVALATPFFQDLFYMPYGLLAIRSSGHPDFWPSGLLAIRPSGHLVIRPSGHLVIWSSGLLAIRPSDHPAI